MHFSGPLVLITGFAGAHGLVIQRDAQPVIDVLNAVKTDIDGLDGAVKSWTGDPTPVLDASKKLVATISEGTATIQSTANLSLGEAVNMLGPVKALKQHSQTLGNDIRGKKEGIEKAGLCGLVRNEIATIGDKSEGLINATVSKVPQGAQSIVKGHAQGILDVLADVQRAFSPENCKKV
ncbi:hydrophobic surface binding protein A domain-containing protein [Cordyceps javanica]|uniref:Hydrophobic surface binding protein A domain-containing protein n=1 Tax=Cordyceps javanica TaxID=43265 RepID=A0A545UU40_9HYPO|nr:hydrophobic surface binding protein A domain-containing protein [Cordyceps javanica]TQW04878.1 hydrophobic surface binding protein A domain-containing protein [Cordyceps javanica]